jgi:hypothetical protein
MKKLRSTGLLNNIIFMRSLREGIDMVFIHVEHNYYDNVIIILYDIVIDSRIVTVLKVLRVTYSAPI